MHVQESAIQHYRGFIEVASCLRTLKTEVSAIGEHLDALTDDLTVLDEACHSFSTGAREHLAKKAQNQQLLSRLLLRAVTSAVSVTSAMSNIHEESSSAVAPQSQEDLPWKQGALLNG